MTPNRFQCLRALYLHNPPPESAGTALGGGKSQAESGLRFLLLAGHVRQSVVYAGVDSADNDVRDNVHSDVPEVELIENDNDLVAGESPV